MYSILQFIFVITCVFRLVSTESLAGNVDPDKGFRVTLFSKWDGPQLYTLSKQTYVPFKAHQSAYTKVIRFSGDRAIKLYTKNDEDASQETYKLLLNISVPKTTIEPLLLLDWNASENLADATVIEFSTRKFGYGSYQIVNLSSTPINGSIGGVKNIYTCDAESQCIVNFDIENGAKTPITAFSTDKKNEPSSVYSILTVHRKRKRVVFFLKLKCNNSGRLICQAQSLVDFTSIK